MNGQHYRIEFKNILENTILPKDISVEERNTRLLPLSIHMCKYMPQTLYRYRECSEMNFDAFNEDKLYAVTSDKFNDPYDCLFRYDKERLHNSIMAGASKEAIYVVRELFRKGGNFPDILKMYCDQDLLDNVRKNIMNADDYMIEKYGEETVSIKDELTKYVQRKIEDAVQTVKQMAFIACFSETIKSVTMWAHYTNSHKGFALEYDPKELQLKCQFCDNLQKCDKAASCNLYPVIYQRQRYDATNFLGWYIIKSMGQPIKNPDTFMIFRSLLYKSNQWSYEKEWRLIVSKMNEFQSKEPICIYNLKPKAIYYGSRISSINKKMLHFIAKEKGIKEYQMYIDNKSYRYSMKYQKV